MTQGAMWHEIHEDGVSLLIALAGEDPDTVENADGWITSADGRRWTATFLTYAELGRILDRWRLTGECLGGSFFTCPDLVITRDPGVQAMFTAIKDLVVTGDHERVLDEIGPEDLDAGPRGRST